jgi:1-acyl-sn-glycerol-3-phosphate acyltransferase
MLSKFLPRFLVGSISFLLHVINTLFWVMPIFVLAFLKVILPIASLRMILDRLLNASASNWISFNAVILKITKPIEWQIDLPEEISTHDWYLVMANHQSWVDILVLQNTFNRKIPFLKFFLKQQLIWVPVLGMAWWALDFPFMKRYSKSYIKKNPHKKGQDFETTQKACEKFKSIPISIMNFSEGTRFTELKRDSQKSPFKNLLKPKAGGIGYVLTLMGNEITKILDVTIDYPNHHSPSFWDLMTGKLDKIIITAKLTAIPLDVRGSYIESSQQRKKVQQWVNQLWHAKDQQLNLIREKE